jgi:large subunit ribosomal protein L6
MSRIGKQPVVVPGGVKVSDMGGVVHVEGPKGKLEYKYSSDVSLAINEGEVVVSCVKPGNQANANYGTTRAIVRNMVIGVKDGFRRGLELHGVGYTAKLNGSDLTLKVGYSHEVVIDVPKVVTCTITGTKIALESCDKVVLGQIAAKVRAVKPPEPYLGVGIRYEGEVVRRKAGKTGKK